MSLQCQTLYLCLQGFYTIQWIDVENVLVIFDSQPTAHRALNELATGPFRMKPYIDSNPNGGTVVAGPGKQTLIEEN